jgi:putative oxidoreductase
MESKRSLRTLIFKSDYNTGSLIVRIVIGLVFLSEGIQKYLFPDLLGVGRFAKIGFSDPAFWAYFVAVFEITCGSLVLTGFLIRVAAIPLFLIMMTAFVTTKWPILIDKGFWAMAHEYRTDFAMTLLLIYLFKYGAGKLSVDSLFFKFSNH